MYGMEVYWDRQEEMRNRLQVWINRGLRGILVAARTTMVNVLLGEGGMRGVEYELNESVAKWGARLIRREFGERFREGWKEEMEEMGVWRGGWEGRIIRGVMKNRLEGEV